MANDDVPAFANPSDEARYYRLQAKDLQDELEDLKLALSDFQSSSKELEDEMEKELASTERRENELRQESERLRSEIDGWKNRHQDTLKEHSKTMSHMQQELERLRTSEKGLRGKLRDIELDNDDLEKSERAISSTLSDVESRYNRAIERTAMLEEELVYKARLEEELQRTKDELRDNVEELAVIKAQRDEAVANAASLATRSQQLEEQVKQSQTLQVSLRSSHFLPVTTPARPTQDIDGGKGAGFMPSPDIDSADESLHHSFGSHKPLVRGEAFFETSSPLTTDAILGSLEQEVKGLTRSDTMQNIAKYSLKQSKSPVNPREKKSEGIINDMRDLTLRMQSMSKSLNARRGSLMAGSAIPRATPRKSEIVRPLHDRNAYMIPRAASSGSITGNNGSARRGMQVHASQSPIEALDEPFKSPPITRPASRLGASSRASNAGDRERSELKFSRPASRLSYGSSVARPSTPSRLTRPSTPSQHLTTTTSTARSLRRVSLGPSSKRTLSVSTDVVPPLPPTPVDQLSNNVTKRSSLANSVRRPANTQPPAWR